MFSRNDAGRILEAVERLQVMSKELEGLMKRIGELERVVEEQGKKKPNGRK